MKFTKLTKSRGLCALFAIFTSLLTAQVGIGTTNPQTSLHVAGTDLTNTLRIEALSSANNAFNNGVDNSVVLVDANGDFILQDRVDDFPVDASEADKFFPNPIGIIDPEGTMASIAVGLGHTVDITLTRETLIEVSFWTGVQLSAADGTAIKDGKLRLIGGLVQDAGTGQEIVYSAQSYTNSNPRGDIIQGFFSIGGNGFITLPAGTHTLQLLIFANGGSADDGDPANAEGTLAIFGANTLNRFQVVFHN